MRTTIRDNYTPELGQYHEQILVDPTRRKTWLFDCDGVFTDITKITVVSERGGSTEYAASQDWLTRELEALEAADITLQDNIDAEAATREADDKTLQDNIDNEESDRIAADTEIWDEIEAIEAASDVVDIVGTYAELEDYDTSALKDNDIIKVLQDETHDDAIAYYRWNDSSDEFVFVGVEGPYYTASETDTLLADKQDKLIAGSNIQIAADGKTISATDTTYTAGTNVQISAGNVISATDTTYSAFTGATSSAAGAEGLVPAPTAGDNMKYLSGDGTWKTINVSSVTVFYYNSGDPTASTLYSDYAMTTAVRGVDVEAAFKQSKVVVYYKNRSNGDIYVEVTNLKYSRWVPGAINVVVAMVSDTYTPSIDGFYYDDKYTTTCSRGTTPLQAPLIAGSNISITDGPHGPEISATDTTYSAFTGATSSVAGAAGLVPAPAAGDDTKYLSGDGTWKTINSSSVTVFYYDYDDPTASTLYSDSAMTTAVKGEDVEAAFNQGKVVVYYKSSSDDSRRVEVTRLGYHRWVPEWLDVVMALGGYNIEFFRYSDKTTTTCTKNTIALQWPLTAGANISITAGPFGDIISATDTTYSDFTGATSSVAGSAGLVPAPTTSDPDKFLKGDGTWGAVTTNALLIKEWS